MKRPLKTLAGPAAAACLGLAMLAAAGGIAAQTPGTSPVAAVAAAMRAGDYAQADQLARAALKQTPSDPRLLTLDGLALSKLGKNAEALRVYDAALQAAPDYVPALEGAAQLEYQAGSDRAAPLLARLLKLRPGDPTTHAMLGVLAYKRGDCKSAAAHFRASGDLASTQPAALEEYGACLARLGRADEAAGVFEQLLAREPADSRARFQLAAAQWMAHRDADAIETLQPLLDGPNPAPAALDLAANAYEDQGKTPEAVKLLRQAIVSAPDNPDYYLDFATIAYNHSSFPVGVDMLTAGLARLPKSAPLYLARGVLYVQMAQYDKAEADFDAAQRLDPRQAFSADAQGLAEFEQSDLDRALATVRARLKQHPNDAFLHYLLAQTLSQRGAAPGSPEFAEAEREARRAVQLKPDLALARDVLGGLYLKEGKAAQAIEQSRLALHTEPADQSALYHLAQALRRSGDPKHEIPALLQRLAALRAQDQKNESAKNQYRLVEPGKPETPLNAPAAPPETQ